MAGDWIKVEHATVDKPEVLAMADLLEISADDVLGKLIRVWIWFDTQSRNGNAGSVTKVTLEKFIDRLVASQGFASCMRKVGWLDDSGIPNFDRHNGKSAKNRALTNKRQDKFRNATDNGKVTHEALPEKRREEKEIYKEIPEGFAEFWRTWPPSERKGSKDKCAEVWKKKKLEPRTAEICAHVEAMKGSRQWADSKFIPSPLVYLNQSKFDGAELPADQPRRLAI